MKKKLSCLILQTKICLKKRVSHFFVSLFEEMMTHLILSHSVTCQPPHALSNWQFRACKAKDHGCCVRRSGEVGGTQAKCMMCVSVYDSVSVYDCTCDWVCVHVCQSEGMDACQRREQHHVRVLVDDAHFRYTNSNSQLSHETISSHDSSTPFLSCVSKLSQGEATVVPKSKWVRISDYQVMVGFRVVDIEHQSVKNMWVSPLIILRTQAIF